MKQFLHVSSEIVALGKKAPPTEQDKFSKHIALGHIRDVIQTPSGRVGRTKGVTYHRTEMRRHEQRAIVKSFPRLAA